MSTASGGPNIVIDGLTWYLDAANTKSYVSGSTVWNTMIRGDRNGVLVNGATFDTGSNSIVFDGTDDYVSSSFNPNYPSGSICMWVYPTTGSSNCFCVYTSGNPLTTWNLVLGRNNFGKLRGYLYDFGARTIDSLGDIDLNVWNHVALTWKNNNYLKIYLNGRLENTTPMYSNQYYSAFYLGAANGGSPIFKAPSRYFKGNIGACQTYNRDLSANEILQNYNAHKLKYNAASPNPILIINPGPYTGSIDIVTSSLAAYYDASIYNSYPYSGSIWYDVSSNNRHAAIYNAVYTSSTSGSLLFSSTGDTYGDLGFNFAGIGLTNEFSYGGWIKPTSTAEFTLLSDYDIDNNGTTLRLNNGIAASDFYIYPGNYRITYSYPFATGSWYNLVAVASGSTMLLYLNGNFAASRSLATNIGVPTIGTTIKIGTRGDYRGPAIGEIANTYIYSKPLSATEVLQNYNATRARFGL